MRSIGRERGLILHSLLWMFAAPSAARTAEAVRLEPRIGSIGSAPVPSLNFGPSALPVGGALTPLLASPSVSWALPAPARFTPLPLGPAVAAQAPPSAAAGSAEADLRAQALPAALEAPGGAAPEASLESSQALFDGVSPHERFEQALASKLVEGSIFNPAFIQRERRQPKTVVFDLDDTLAILGVGPSGEEEYRLRAKIDREIRKMRGHGYRLVLWSASSSREVALFFRQYPALLPYFDRLIAGENWMVPAALEGADPEFKAAYESAQPEKVSRFYSVDNPKDLSLFGYALLVDNNKELAAAAPHAPFGGFAAYPIRPFTRDGDSEPVEELTPRLLALLRRPR